MRTTKQQYIEAINNLGNIFMEYCRVTDSKTVRDLNIIIIRDRIYSKHMGGRYYIHSKASLTDLENLYADLVNFHSDFRI